jgi:hypothetical protein
MNKLKKETKKGRKNRNKEKSYKKKKINKTISDKCSNLL